MKRIITTTAVLAAMSVLSISAFADVTVTIADKDGKLAVSQESVEYKDIDGDGAVTINDVLIAAHDKFYDGGSEAGYTSTEGDYGLMITKLWGEENGGSYGYYHNTSSAMSLADTVEDGDSVSAFIYTDLTTWSDKFCYFEEALSEFGCTQLGAQTGSEVTVTLLAASFDENWAPVTVPVSGAEIIIDGEKTGVKTDDNGKAAITVPSETGDYIISAVSDTEILVPPVLKLSSEDMSNDVVVDDAEEIASGENDEVISTGDVAAIADSSKGSPDTGIEDVAAIAGLAAISAGAIALTRKRK